MDSCCQWPLNESPYVEWVRIRGRAKIPIAFYASYVIGPCLPWFLCPKPKRARSAFAFWLYGGRVITWGDEKYGGDCCDVQDQLQPWLSGNWRGNILAQEFQGNTPHKETSFSENIDWKMILFFYFFTASFLGLVSQHFLVGGPPYLYLLM